jgi:hypothetical protein
LNKCLRIVQDNHNNRLILVSVGEMNNFTEVCKLSDFCLSENRVHPVNMKHTCLSRRSFNLSALYKAATQLGPTSFYKEARTHILRSATFSYKHSIYQVQSLFLPVMLRCVGSLCEDNNKSLVEKGVTGFMEGFNLTILQL